MHKKGPYKKYKVKIHWVKVLKLQQVYNSDIVIVFATYK